MYELSTHAGLLRNFAIYLAGVGLAVVGALGLAEAIQLSLPLAGGFFVVGLAAVVAVHEYFDGPI